MKAQWKGFQSPLADGIRAYLAQKRALGRRFRSEEMELRLFDRFLVERRVQTIGEIRAELLDAFLASRPRHQPRSYNHLIGAVRRLFDWLVLQGILRRSPLCAKARRETARRIPCLFDASQASRLLSVAGDLPDRNGAPLRGATYRTIFALLYGLGLRVGEVSRLCVKDLDLERQLLVIRETKFSKSRLVPFGPRMGELLRQHVQLRDGASGPLSLDAPLFSFRQGRPIHPYTITQTFHQLLPRLALRIPAGVAPPRVHDLRHAFAVGTLLRWYRQGLNPSSRLLHLSTFLGHVDPTSTAVYLTMTADLFREANHRFERFVAPTLAEARR